MLFWKKKNEIVLNCYTYSDFAYNFSKIDYGSNFFPNWWKKTPKISNDEATIKNCVALQKFYTKGIVIPSWFEMEILITPGPKFQWISSNIDVDTSSTHKSSQFQLLAENDSINMKLSSVWKFTTDDEIYFSWTQPTWNNKNMLKYMNILPGVIEFKYQVSSEINYLIRNPDEEKFYVEIPAQTPLVILHPLTDKKIKIINHKISKEEWVKMSLIEKMILRENAKHSISTYKKKKKIIDNLEQRCPFHK